MLYLNTKKINEAIDESTNLTLTNVVFEFYKIFFIIYKHFYLTLTNVVFE